MAKYCRIKGVWPFFPAFDADFGMDDVLRLEVSEAPSRGIPEDIIDVSNGGTETTGRSTQSKGDVDNRR